MLDLLARPGTTTMPATPPAIPPALPGVPLTGAAHPGQPGRSRVFTGDWLANGCDCHLYTDGYVGDLVRRWNGWAVFPPQGRSPKRSSPTTRKRSPRSWPSTPAAAGT